MSSAPIAIGMLWGERKVVAIDRVPGTRFLSVTVECHRGHRVPYSGGRVRGPVQRCGKCLRMDRSEKPARLRRDSVGSTLTAADVAAMKAALRFARSHGFVQTHDVVRMTQKVHRLAAIIASRRMQQSENAAA